MLVIPNPVLEAYIHSGSLTCHEASHDAGSTGYKYVISLYVKTKEFKDDSTKLWNKDARDIR